MYIVHCIHVLNYYFLRLMRIVHVQCKQCVSDSREGHNTFNSTQHHSQMCLCPHTNSVHLIPGKRTHSVAPNTITRYPCLTAHNNWGEREQAPPVILYMPLLYMCVICICIYMYICTPPLCISLYFFTRCVLVKYIIILYV